MLFLLFLPGFVFRHAFFRREEFNNRWKQTHGDFTDNTVRDSRCGIFVCEYNLLYINMLDHQGEIGIDWNTDTYDAGLHLNVYGAEKVTAWLGKLLADKCHVPDRRSEETLAAAWSEKSARYYEQKRRLENEKN